MIEATLTAVVDAAKGGIEMTLPSFGKFKVQKRPERQDGNPATSEVMTLVPHRKLAFYPAKAVKAALNG